MKEFYAKCANCGKGMNEGYSIDAEPYCSEACRATVISDAKNDAIWEDEEEGYDQDYAYYTAWEEPDEFMYDANGNVIYEVEA